MNEKVMKYVVINNETGAEVSEHFASSKETEHKILSLCVDDIRNHCYKDDKYRVGEIY